MSRSSLLFVGGCIWKLLLSLSQSSIELSLSNTQSKLTDITILGATHPTKWGLLHDTVKTDLFSKATLVYNYIYNS